MKKIYFAILSICFFTVSYAGVVTVEPCLLDFKSADFPFVGGIYNRANGSAGSAVVLHGGQYIMTAKHCVTLSMDLTDDIVAPSEIIFITEGKNITTEAIFFSDITDLAICRLSEKVDSGVKIISIVSDDEFYGVGVGRGASKVDHQKIDFDLPYGTKRVFKNELQGLFMKNYTDKQCKDYKILMYYFMLRGPNSKIDIGQAIMGEGMHGPGDSGGGIFSRFDNQFYLLGIIDAIYDEAPITGFAVELATHRKWIESVVPEAFYDVFPTTK